MLQWFLKCSIISFTEYREALLDDSNPILNLDKSKWHNKHNLNLGRNKSFVFRIETIVLLSSDLSNAMQLCPQFPSSLCCTHGSNSLLLFLFFPCVLWQIVFGLQVHSFSWPDQPVCALPVKRQRRSLSIAACWAGQWTVPCGSLWWGWGIVSW